MQKLVLTPELFDRFRTLLGDAAGLEFDENKLPTLQAHLRDRARAAHCASLEDYYQLVAGPAPNRDELRKLIETVTVHETSFFRNHEHYQALRERVLPEVIQRNAGTRRIRIWSAGCSTGEEPYSLAITCLEDPQLAGWDIRIEATDLSERVLAMARRGMYRAEALRYLEPERIARWFRHQKVEEHVAGTARPTGPLDPIRGQREAFSIADQVRQLVHFQTANLAKWPYPANCTQFDVIFCENVIIYLQPEIIRRVIDEFYQRLVPGGALFLGYSETLWQISDRFELITCPGTFYYQRPLVGPAAEADGVRRAGRARIDLQEVLRKLSETAALTPQARSATDGGLAAAPPRVGQAASPDLASAPGRMARPRPQPVKEAPTTPPAGVAATPADLDPAVAIALAEQLVRHAHTHLEAGRYAEAQAAFTAALARNPAAVGALAGLAQIHANQGRLAQARTECEKALAQDALCEEAHLLSALIARHEERYDDAVEHLEKLVHINGESVAAHYYLAEIYRGQERPDDAAHEYRRTIAVLNRNRNPAPIAGVPAAMIRQACERQLRRLRA